MSLWKCRSSWFDVELSRAGAVVPAKDRDVNATEHMDEILSKTVILHKKNAKFYCM